MKIHSISFPAFFLILYSITYSQQNKVSFVNKFNDNALSVTTVYSIIENNNKLWVGTKNGLYSLVRDKFDVYRNQPNDSTSLSSNWVETMLIDKYGNFWVGTVTGGLNKFNFKNNNFIRYYNNPYIPQNLNNNVISSIYQDKEGNLWIGTGTGGFYKYDYSTSKFIVYKENYSNPKPLDNNNIKAFCEDSAGNFWIGTWGGGLNKFNRSENSFTFFKNIPNVQNSLSDNNIWCITEAPDSSGKNVLWIGTGYGGMDMFDPSTGKFKHFVNDPNNKNSISDNWIRVIYKDRKNNLWIGTDKGLDYFIVKENKFIHFVHEDNNSASLSHSYVISVLEDSSGRMWIGTYRGFESLHCRISK